jgi:predicted secreted protein
MSFLLNRFYFRLPLFKLFLASCLFLSAGYSVAQIAPGTTKSAGALDEILPEIIKADTVDKVLALFKPGVNKDQLIKSDYLLLDSPPIAKAGIMSVRMMSELPGTEFFLLFNTNPSIGKPSFLVAQSIPNLTKADVRVKIKLTRSSDLLMIVRAAGRWYSVTNDVKVAIK